MSFKPAADLRKQLDLEWQVGDKYDMLKRSGARSADPALSEYVGGIGDPYKVVLGRSTALSLGIRLRAAWEAFEKRHPGAVKVAETYGTPDCTLDKVTNYTSATDNVEDATSRLN